MWTHPLLVTPSLTLGFGVVVAEVLQRLLIGRLTHRCHKQLLLAHITESVSTPLGDTITQEFVAMKVTLGRGRLPRNTKVKPGQKLLD